MNMRHVHTPGRRRLLSAGLTLAGLSLFGFGLPSTAVAQDCGQGWVQRTAEGPSTYEICYDEARGVTVAYWDQRTWEWDGEAWSLVAEVADGPGPRGAGAMVYDPYGERCLLFGGYSTGSAKRDLWSWDGSVWTQLSAGPNVSGRGDFAMAFDRGRNRLVVHGGYPGSGSLLQDTLEWNPDDNSWQVWSTSSVGRLYAHRMAYDEARGQLVMHGGFYFTNKNDTWIWTGSNWSHAGNTGPARYVFGMTYDSRRDELVLHGGTTCCGEVEYGGTYRWNGSAWTPCPFNGPPRGYMNIAYDRARDVLVLPGGAGPLPGGGRGNVPETWELVLNEQCLGDFNDDGRVAAADLGMLIGAWGRKGKLPYDLDGDGTVGQGDLASLLAAWGVCP